MSRKIKHSGQFKKGHIPWSMRHGMSHTKIYNVWQAMRRRCDEIKYKDFKHYGARGISYDSAWNDFALFFNDMKETYKQGLELDRIDNNGNYCKENCRWTDKKTQRNNKRNNHFIEFNGNKMTLAQWSDSLGINYSTLRSRAYRCWSIKRILTTL